MNEESRGPAIAILCNATPQEKQANVPQDAQGEELGSVLDDSMMEKIWEVFLEKMMVKLSLKRGIGLSQADSFRVKSIFKRLMMQKNKT